MVVLIILTDIAPTSPMARKPTKGYFVRGQFVAEGSELDEQLKRELHGEHPSKTEQKAQSAELQALGQQLLTLRADLRDPLDTAALGQTKTLTNNVSMDPRSDRSLIASKAGSGSSGITTANASRGFGGGAGALSDHTTVAMHSGIADAAARGSASPGVETPALRSSTRLA